MISKPPRARYRTTNWPADNASLKRRGSLMVWLDPEHAWQAAAGRRAGRPAVFSDAAIQFCLTLKCMYGLGLRQATGLVKSLLKLAHLDWNVPDYSTLSRRQKTPSVSITARPSQGGLYLLVDSTSMKMLGEGEWKISRKYGADYRRQWRKVHLGVNAQTLEIRAIEVTDNAIGDAPMLPQLLAQIPEDELLHSVSADGADDTMACYEAKSSPTRHSLHPDAQKCQALSREPGRSSSEKRETRNEKRDLEGEPGSGTFDLEEMEWRSPTQSYGNQDGLLQKTGGAGDGPGLRASSR